MKIWVDADACPNPAKELIFRAGRRLEIETVLVADRPVGHPPSPFISARVVPKGLDAADKAIIQEIEAGDLVITADLPLAAEAVAKGALAISPRGEIHTPENVSERLSLRDFMTSLRDAGLETGGPPPYSKKDRQKFAEALEKSLLRLNCC